MLPAERERRFVSFTLLDGAETGRVLASERERDVAVLGRTFTTKEWHDKDARLLTIGSLYISRAGSCTRRCCSGTRAHKTCTETERTTTLYCAVLLRNIRLQLLKNRQLSQAKTT